MDMEFIWLTACEVVVGPRGTSMAPASRQPAAALDRRRRRRMLHDVMT
jgi:hypothetical protein